MHGVRVRTPVYFGSTKGSFPLDMTSPFWQFRQFKSTRKSVLTKMKNVTNACTPGFYWHKYFHFSLTLFEPGFFGSLMTRGGLMPDKRIYNFQTPRTIPTNGLKKWPFLVLYEVYESWANWTIFLGSWENGEFFWDQTCCTLFHTQNEEKSQKISTRIRIHTRVYANTWWGGQICPPR